MRSRSKPLAEPERAQFVERMTAALVERGLLGVIRSAMWAFTEFENLEI